MNTETNKFVLPAAVILAGLLIAGAVIWNGSHPSGSTGGQQAAQVNIKDVKINGEPYLGKADAPVTVAFWSDFQCPYCKNFELQTLPQIVQNYVDTGKVKIVFFDYNFLGNDSVTAGAYARAIWKLYPDQYFAWRTAMYNAQDEEGDKGFGNAASIDKLNATITGLDAAKIAADVKANMSAYQAQMDADKAEGVKFGIQATPSFIIGTDVIQGAYPYATFETALAKVVK